MNLNSQKLRWVLLGLIAATALVFIIIASSGLGSLSQKSQKLVDLKTQSRVVNDQLVNLQIAKKQVAQYGYFKDVAKTVIPSDKDQAQAVLDISNFADQAGFLIATITFPSSTLGGISAGAASSSSAQSTSAVTASPTTVISQAKPVTGAKGLYSIELTITPQTGANVPADKKVTYAKMLDFLQRIERNRRTAQISQVTVQPKSDQGDIPFSIVVNIFIRPVKS